MFHKFKQGLTRAHMYRTPEDPEMLTQFEDLYGIHLEDITGVQQLESCQEYHINS